MAITPTPADSTPLGLLTSARDLLKAALRLIRITEATPEEWNDALYAANQMLDAWDADRPSIFTLNINDFPFVMGDQTYSLGTGGDFDLARPSKLERASVVIPANAAQPLELPLDMLSDAEWQDVHVKLVQSAYPRKMYDDGAHPFRNLSFWPIPTVTCSFRLYSWAPLLKFASLDTKVILPPGYLEAIKYNLAPRLAPEFGVQTPTEVAVLAESSLAKIKTQNLPSPVLRVPASFSDDDTPYNWLTDEPAR